MYAAKLYLSTLVLVSLVVAHCSAQEKSLPRLKVSDNHRFLVTEKSEPFFWLGDTAWELFHRLNREDAIKYLDIRKEEGFNIVQAVAIAEFDGHTVPNANGHLPLVDLDPSRPATKDGPNNDYWDHVDEIVKLANERGMYVGFLPTWGRYWHDKVQDGKPIFTRENAEKYGEFLGKRYKDAALVWILGGDRPVENDEQKEIIRAMARGLAKGDGGAHLMTFHPPGGAGSSQWWHGEDWLSFNMRQNGHSVEFTGRYDQTAADYDRQPTKPVIDGEPVYEDHPINFNAKGFGHSIAADVRRAFYWDVFSGACGHTYGHHTMWQFWKPGLNPVNDPLLPWEQAIVQPGAKQMKYGKQLMESRPMLTRIPDSSLIVADQVQTAVPGAGRYRFVATRDQEGTYAFVYAPIGRAFKVKLDTLKGTKLIAWWYNPRTGEATKVCEVEPKGEKEFLSPEPGELLDWVLVLDSSEAKYPPPGEKAASGK